MTKVKAVPNSICKGLMSLGISKVDTRNILNQIDKWVRANGVEWTVSRLKEYKQLYIHHYLNEDRKYKPSSWIKTNSEGTPRGPFSIFFRAPKTNRNIRRALSALTLYAGFTMKEVTPKQWKKFHHSATQSQSNPRPGELLSGSAVSILKGEWDYNSTHSGIAYHSFNEALILEINARVSGVKSKDFAKAGNHLKAFFRDARDETSYFYRFSNKFMPQLMLNPLLRYDYSDVLGQKNTPNSVGNLGYTQEPGGKLRVFAAPYCHWQAILQPLKQHLFDVLRRVPSDCTYDQRKGVEWVKCKLKEGHLIHSVDLSDATNNFPYKLQEDLMRAFKVPLYYQTAMKIVARGTYNTPKDIQRTFGVSGVEWNVGQPLGAGPSFALFSLTHHALVLSIAEKLGIKNPTDQYRILGDDIVFANDSLAQAYRKVLTTLEIPISLNKCISGKVAEFAGAIIREDLDVHAYKFTEPSDISFIAVARNFPSLNQARRSFSKDQFAWLKFIEDVHEPLGLGRNTLGQPVSIRTEKELLIQEFYNELKETPPKRKGVDLLNAFNYALDNISSSEGSLYRNGLVHIDQICPVSQNFLVREITLSEGGDPRPKFKPSKLRSGIATLNVRLERAIDRANHITSSPVSSQSSSDYDYHDAITQEHKRLVNLCVENSLPIPSKEQTTDMVSKLYLTGEVFDHGDLGSAVFGTWYNYIQNNVCKPQPGVQARPGQAIDTPKSKSEVGKEEVLIPDVNPGMSL